MREIPPAEVPALIAAHDVVLVPSLEEGFGVVAAEAIASGRWVVASSVGGLPEVVEDGVNGALVGDGRFAEAIASVPDYDPQAVSGTAARFAEAPTGIPTWLNSTNGFPQRAAKGLRPSPEPGNTQPLGFREARRYPRATAGAVKYGIPLCF